MVSMDFGLNCFILFFSTYCVMHVLALEFKDITSDVFVNNQYSGVIAALGDFNSDKLTDIFIITQDAKSVEILFSNDSLPFFGYTVLRCAFKRSVTGLIPGDFDGDSMMDILVSLEDDSGLQGAAILWGKLDSITCGEELIIDVSGQPFIMDYNDDMIPDIMGEDSAKKRCIWLSNSNKTSTKMFILPEAGVELESLRVPHSSAVVDLNNDLVSDLLVTGQTKIEFWIKHGKSLNYSRHIGYPEKAKVYGQSTFVDFNTNGKLDHIMPVCYDEACRQSAVMIWNNDTSSWMTLIKDFTHEKTAWGFFRQYQAKSALERSALTITLRAGDFNMDGYPDFLVVLENKDKPGETQAVILENVPCALSKDCSFGQTLLIHWNVSGLNEIPNVELATFYDVFEDGTMDILSINKINEKWRIHVLKNMDTYDAYFIKVLVLSGLCYDDCESGRIPYGTNQPGPMIRYNTTKPNGDPLVSCAVQLSQSAHFPLQLPYSVFGLGQTPNFVDLLTVAIPEMMHDKIHKREWNQIIPNSQMVVIPHPPDKANQWVNKLFLTPSRLVFLTFLALLGTCVFIGLIIFLLHWKEKIEDKKEKMQEAYRFHFDAM